MSRRRIEVMDTTLRDGEQTPEIAYTPAEKLQMAKLLLSEVGVDRIEIAGTRVSEGERQAAKQICKWAKQQGKLQSIEMLGYCDGKLSVDWLFEAGGRVLNLLVKGSEKHCRGQLRMTPEKHRKQVASTIAYARKRRVRVNVYLEDWSSGVRHSFDYVFAMMQTLIESKVERVYLADTLGMLSPETVTRYVGLMTGTWPDVRFEFHGHNDYGFATANCLAAVNAGAVGVHTSVNGMGERAGNTKLAEVVPALHDHGPYKTGVQERRLVGVSRLVELFSGKDVAGNAPIVGGDVFTHAAGIHADGDAKGDLYTTELSPDRFARERRYALGKLSGKASVNQNLKLLGISLSEPDRDLVLQRVVELGDKKHAVRPEDLRFIIADVLKAPSDQMLRVEDYQVNVATQGTPTASVVVTYQGERSEAEATGDGGYDAFMNALKKAVRRFGIDVPRLTDFRVRIPPGGRTSALVETVIQWAGHDDEDGFTTLGVDSDQIAAAVLASEKMLNVLATRERDG